MTNGSSLLTNFRFKELREDVLRKILFHLISYNKSQDVPLYQNTGEKQRDLITTL